MTMNKTEFAYVASIFADYQDVRAGEKPLLIVSEGKSEFGFTTLLDLAEDDGLEWIIRDLVCEDGEIHDHLFIAQPGAPYPYEAYQMIMDAVSESADDRTSDNRKRGIRAQLQLRLGMMLGYTAGDCVEFINSDLGKTCPCDCCGSPYTVLSPATDPNPSRFVENAYQY